MPIATKSTLLLKYLTSCIVFLNACSSGNQKKTSTIQLHQSDTLIIKLPEKINITLKYKDFQNFYMQFIKDTVFQMQRVIFPINGQYEDSDTGIIWLKEKWPYMTWDLREAINQDDSTAIIQTDHSFFYGTYCLDCGFSFEMKFEKRNDKWYLVYRQENNY